MVIKTKKEGCCSDLSKSRKESHRPLVQKATAALTGLTVGAAAFHRLGGDKIVAKNLPKMGKFLGSVADDLSEMTLKDYDAKNISSLYKKHISGENSTLKSLKSLSDAAEMQSVKINLRGNNFASGIVKMKEIQSNAENFMRELFNGEYASTVSRKLSAKHNILDEELSEQVDRFVKHVIDKENLTVLEVSREEIQFNNKLIKEFGLEEQPSSFFDDLLIAVRDEKEEALKEYRASHMDAEGNYDFIKNATEQFTGKAFAEVHGTTADDSLLSQFIKGSRAATVGDYIDDDRFVDQIITLANGEEISLKDTIKEFADGHEVVRNILLDAKNLRIDANNDIIDMQEVSAYKKEIARGFAGTLPGKLAKVTDILSLQEPETFNILSKGNNSDILKALDGEGGKRLKNNYVQVMNNLFQVDENNEFKKIDDFGEFDVMSSKHGTIPRLYKKMFGTGPERAASGKWSKRLDVGTSSESTIIDDLAKEDSAVGRLTRKVFGGKQYNVIDRLYDADLIKNDSVVYRKNALDMSYLFSHITKAPSNKTISRVQSLVKDDLSKEIMGALQLEDQEEMITVLSHLSGKFQNKDLDSLVKAGTRDRQNVAKMLSIQSDKITSGKNVMQYQDLVKREAFKEVLLNQSVNPETGLRDHSEILYTLRRAGVKGKDYDNARNLANWAVFQNEGNLFGNNRNSKDFAMIKDSNEKVMHLLTMERKKNTFIKNAEFVEQFQDAFNMIKSNYSDLTLKNEAREKANRYVRAETANDVVLLRKGYSPKSFAKDMIKDINDTSKMKANTKKFGMQFIAGSNSSEYVTSYTMLPYFLTERLIDPFNKIGAGFSSENMTSVGKQWGAIMSKRVLPTAAGITAFSYLNYETKNLTGTSITGAMAQGIANTDLGVRKIADATGVRYLLNKERKLNPLTQYWFGDDYQDSNERKEYYENGYDEMRKGRWWAFGSASEFRGGKISYYQPNYVKRANSDWKDIGLYGSSKEKWAHSWVPTPRHPFAPLRKALDPYWLERKHYEDRPYMETAPLFSTGTPWGTVLNPTIGEMIKPVRKMHKNETRRGLTDQRTLIARRNERIKEKAIDKEHENLINVSQDGVSNIKYTPNALADPEKLVISMTASNGRIHSVDYNGVGYTEGLADISDVTASTAPDSYTGTGVMINASTSIFDGTGIIGALETTKVGAAVSNQVRGETNYSPTYSIGAVNQDIKSRAIANGSTFEKTNLATMPASQAALRVMTKQDEADLLLTISKHDFINDTLFSVGQQTGIYNYLFGVARGDQGRKVRLENADKMASFKTGFWDANVGGLGGGVMEIARRFFPHDDHNWTDINPIRNTMPDWMPERFQIGDPYRKVSKGEMRLPGAGYESIHKLRPDQYGKYGALDRMRILGDIAPWSDEYKIWRDIAKETVTDSEGKKEIEAIKKRVSKQSRSHEFFNYNYLGSPTEIASHTIESIDGTSITTTSGKSFNIAGVTLAKGADLSRYLGAGMTIQAEYLKKEKNYSSISAAIYVDGESINQRLISSGEATEKENGGVMDTKALTGHFGQLYGAAMEAVAHAPIPFVHNKLMRVDTALESYKNERVYGTPYSTWAHPIKGFIEPSFHKAWARGPVGQSIALGGWAAAEYLWKYTDKAVDALEYMGFKASVAGVNKAASILMNATNPGSFAGSMMAAIPTGLMDSGGLKGMVSASVFGSGAKEGIGRNAARLGATAMIAGYGITRSEKPLQSTAIFAAAGVSLSKQLKHEAFGTREGAIAGAVTGLMLSALRNPRFDKEKMLGVYTPESTKHRWDIDEYYDRLEYIKYQGLYEKAARKAKVWERTDIKKIINANEYARTSNKKKIEKLNNRLEKISNSNLEDIRKEELISSINSKLYELNTSEQVLRGGKYTKAAVAYKQAADSTIYGLKEGATSQQVLRAIPKGDKDFFMDFMKEDAQNKRKQILKHVSPYQRKALQIAWGEKKIDSVDSNNKYFKNHFLPGVFWAGWKPQVDMENVKIKTIENEGMLLSDFGIYESVANEPSAVMAPSVGTFDQANTGSAALKARLQGTLNGTGLLGVKVSVSPSSASGIEVIANITNSAKITEYKIRESLGKAVGVRMFY